MNLNNIAGNISVKNKTPLPFDCLIEDLVKTTLKTHPIINPTAAVEFHDGPCRKVVRRSNCRSTLIFPSKKNATRITCESLIEYEGFQYLESHWSVKNYREQPAIVKYLDDGEWHTHYPDCFVELVNGQFVFVEFKDNDYYKDLTLLRRTTILQNSLEKIGYLYLVVVKDQMPSIRTYNAAYLARKSSHNISMKSRMLYELAFKYSNQHSITTLQKELQGLYSLKELCYLIRSGKIWYDWAKSLDAHTILIGRF